MNKKVGIVTLYHDNYNCGAVLQALALQKAVEKLGFEGDVIDYERKTVDLLAKKINYAQKILNKLKRIKTKGDVIDLFMLVLKKDYAHRYVKDIALRKEAYLEFITKNLSISKGYNFTTISLANNFYDCFICGSDQIWRPSSFDANYYLDFADENKVRVSYAASLGVSSLSQEQKAYMGPLIQKLDAVSVRESSTVSMIQEITTKEVISCIDPTLLFDVGFWRSFIKSNKLTSKDKYIFSYIIGENNKNREVVKEISRRTGLPIVAMPGISRILPYDFMYADENIVVAAPDDFLTLIENAEYIVTDSFHACVFSILFKKRFFVLERFAKNTEDSMNSRIYDLLKLFKLKDRLIDKNTDLSKIDYEKSIIPDYVGWEKQKAESWIYLDKSLKLHPKSELAIKHKMPKGYIIKSKDEQVVNNSSSGGVFYHLAKWVIMNDGVVFGAVIDNQGLIKHSAATTMDALEPMMSSKYVQSEMGNCFKEALDYLKQGIPVLFSGTPCQVRGFYNFIGDRSKYDKLYLIDFVCHGVPSPKVWKLYLDEVLKGSKVYRISFRDKTFGWNKFSLRITRENKKTHLKNKERDAFILGFLNNLYLRPSCYKCKVKGIERRSDVTLADAWHITEIDPTIKDDDKGISTVFIHTDEGEELLHQIEDEVHIHQIDAEKLLEMNQNAILCPIIPKNRTDFFKHISNQSGNQKIEKIIQKNLNISKISKIKKTIKKVIR